MSPDQELMERLAAADPARGSEDPGTDETDALLSRILAEPQRSRRRRRVPTLLLAGAAAAVAGLALFVALDLVDSDPPGPEVVAKAVAAVSIENGIFHVQARERQVTTAEEPSLTAPAYRWRTTYYTESWFGPGKRMHSKMFRSTNGRRGAVGTEVAGRTTICRTRRCRANGTGYMYNRRRNVAQPVGLAPAVASSPGYGSPSMNPFADPAATLRQAAERGQLRVAGETQFDGRKAYKLVSKRFPIPRNLPKSDMHVEFLVDAETYLPLEEKLIRKHRFTRRDLRNAEQPAAMRKALRTGRTLVTGVMTRRYLVYERLPLTRANRAKLRIQPRPGAVLIRPDGKRVSFRG